MDNLWSTRLMQRANMRNNMLRIANALSGLCILVMDERRVMVVVVLREQKYANKKPIVFRIEQRPVSWFARQVPP
jgi:hypothetical protein